MRFARQLVLVERYSRFGDNAPLSCNTIGSGSDRSRGVVDQGFVDETVSIMSVLGGTYGIIEKWKTNWPTKVEQNDLGLEMLNQISKAPRDGINDVAFDKEIKDYRSIRGHIHPVFELHRSCIPIFSYTRLTS